MNKTLVTIYITNYNYGKYLTQSIESVLHQTYQFFELIIIDDGSTDGSIDIIELYKNNSKITIIKQKRKGLNASNNVALKNAKGKYIIRLDADDFLLDTALEKMVNILDSNDDIALVFPDYNIVDHYNRILRTVKRHDFEKDVTLFDQPAHGACTMIRTKILKYLGGYDEQFDRQDGYDLWLKVIDLYKIKNINIPLFNYRFHNSNLTKDNYSLLRTRAEIKKKRVTNLNKSPLNIEVIIPIRGKLLEPLLSPLKIISKTSLLGWTLNAALESEIKENITIATHDIKIKDFITKNYDSKVDVLIRRKKHARYNLSLEKTILEFLDNIAKTKKLPDALMILYIAYPFKQSWQINESIDTMKLFDVDVVDGVIPDNRIFYQHDGKGLNTLVDGGGLHMERDELYRRVGGIHLIKTDFFLKHKKMIAGRIGHIQFDNTTAFQINNLIDWDIAETILINSSNLKEIL